MKTIPNNRFFAWVEAEIAEGRAVCFRLKGNSMFPLLRNGMDEVVLYPCAKEELKPMDVVLFRYQGKHVLHRILRIEGEQLLIQGDGVYASYERCTSEDVVGKVKEVVRPSGKIISVEQPAWRLTSRLWRMMGWLRRPLLRILHKLVK